MYLLVLSMLYLIIEMCTGFRLVSLLIPDTLRNFSPLFALVTAAVTAFLGIVWLRLSAKSHSPSRKIRNASLASRSSIQEFYDSVSKSRKHWDKKSKFYRQEVLSIFRYLVPAEAKVLELGCSTGELIGRLPQKEKFGLDFSKGMIDKAKSSFGDVQFERFDLEMDDPAIIGKQFDYVLMCDLLAYVFHVQKTLHTASGFMHDDSRLVVSSYNFLWEPVLKVLEILRIKMPQPTGNWLSNKDLENFFALTDLDVVKSGMGVLLPGRIPLLSWFCNKILVRIPLFRALGLMQYYVLKKRIRMTREYSVSVVIPARNEAGNIEDAVLRTPAMGKWTELIFVEGNSTDNTWEEIVRIEEKYKGKYRIKTARQTGKGKGDAVRKGFSIAEGDIVTILDADLTMSPEELPLYYEVIARQQADFVNGSRLVYRLESEAMRSFNILGNKFFSLMFSWLLSQPIKDTLCGTKMLRKYHYDQIVANRSYFGDFDPFGDFDLLFGASKLNLLIKDLPIHYKARVYGSTNIQRWKHGLILLKMVCFAAPKIKFF